MRALLPVVLATTALLLASGCGATGTVEAGADISRGKTLFQESCAGCHTLADAAAKGTSGPNLDDAFGQPAKQGFDESTIRDVVRGQIAYASPPMPRGLVTGDDADAVATYVAQVAGKPVQGGGVEAAPAPGAPDTATEPDGTTTSEVESAAPPGRDVFTANCAACHRLAAANASGTVGPDLDQTKPSQDTVAHQVEVGGGAMPAFKGRLTDQQIEDVASYVASVAGG